MCIKPTSAGMRRMKALRERIQYITMTKARKQIRWLHLKGLRTHIH